MFAHEPSYAHKALRSLEIDGLLQGIITTNVDCMHTIAGSENVAEIQGSLQINRCTKQGEPRHSKLRWSAMAWPASRLTA